MKQDHFAPGPLTTLATLGLALVLGCGDDDGGVDATPALQCTDIVLDTTFALAPLAPAPQIHANVIFDGAAVWLAYNLVDDEGFGGFDVFARRIKCDGTALGEPLRVTTTLGGNDIDPALALSDGVVAIVWTADNQTGVDNMDALYRTYTTDGGPIMAADVILETSRNSAPVTGNVMQSTITALPEGEFAVGGLRGLAEATSFQAFIQRIDSAGTFVGEAIDGYFESDVSHSLPSVAGADDGTIYVAWVRSPPAADDRVVNGRIAPGASVVTPSPPQEVIAGDSGGSPSYAVGGDGAVYVAYGGDDSDRDIILAVGNQFDGGAASTSFGGVGRLDHSPTVAAAGGGGAVAYYRNVSGIRNQVVVQPFTYDGASFTLGNEELLDTESAAPYGAAITHVRDNIYFVAWSAGASPDLFIEGRFVSL